MKTLFILFFIISLTFFSQEEYKVIKVSGTIILEKDKSFLKRGSLFKDNDKLKFKTTNARAAVLKPGKGRFILKPNNSNTMYARANLTPSMNNISSRGTGITSSIDLNKYFTGNFVILNQSVIKINLEQYEMNDENFFYIRYYYNNEEVNKKLSHRGDTLIIEKVDLFLVDGAPIPDSNIKNMKLYYRTQSTKESQLISSFQPVFPNTEELKQEVEMILKEIENQTEREKNIEVINYINEMYGKIDTYNVEYWITNN